VVSLLQKLVIKQQKLILKLQLNSTHSLMRKDLTGHTGPLTYAHNKTKQNKHAKFIGNTATWQTATLFSSLLNVFKEGASTTI